LQSGDAQAITQALKLIVDRSKPLPLRIEIAKALGQVKAAKAEDLLVRIATGRAGAEPALQRTAIQALAYYDNPRIADQLVASFYSRISDQYDLRATACRTLSSRPVWAARLLQEVNQWRLKPAQVPQDVVQRLRTYDDEPLAAQVQQAFGKLIPLSTEQQVARYKQIESIVAVTKSDPKEGRKVFQAKCANCHQLFGEGKQLGPPLDGYERGNLAFWINNLVAPSAEIREGYQTFRALTEDGRVITGTVAQQDQTKVVLRTDQDQLVTLPKDQLEQFGPVSISLMPEGLLKDLSDQEIADLMSYLRL
jgi:putative heme-binding domain-containing protein